jgi:hypothetical protein
MLMDDGDATSACMYYVAHVWKCTSDVFDVHCTQMLDQLRGILFPGSAPALRDVLPATEAPAAVPPAAVTPAAEAPAKRRAPAENPVRLWSNAERKYCEHHTKS